MASLELLIPVINQLQDVFTTLGDIQTIDLPQIVLIGSQSSGKSSVLEHIVGRDFLPRGSGIVTRRPLVLQCINIPMGKGAHEEWGEFLHKPDQKFPDFEKIRDEIVNETSRVVGQGKGISRIPIHLKVYSPHILNLTLVDLPGMTRVPIGDQPPDIELQIRGMIMEYIAKKNALVLAVSAANSDIATSDALRLAKEVDPDGTRTLGVVTKIDIMDKGTDALDLLLGKIIPLRLGFVGVVLRSQEDIKKGLPIRDALKSETKFFQTHPVYRQISSRCGTEYLTKILNMVLMNHIRDCLPELKLKVNQILAQYQSELESYGDSSSSVYDGSTLLSIITKFSNDYKMSIEGTSGSYDLHELYGGARINFIFNDILNPCVNKIDPLEGLTQNHIRTAICNVTGPKSVLLIPEAAFEILVKQQIKRLEDPCVQCIDYIFDELQRSVNQHESKDLNRFGKLRDEIILLATGILHKCRTPAKEMINNLISAELSYINIHHPDFIGANGAFAKVTENLSDVQLFSTGGGQGNSPPDQQGSPSTRSPPPTGRPQTVAYTPGPGRPGPSQTIPRRPVPKPNAPHQGGEMNGGAGRMYGSPSGGGNYRRGAPVEKLGGVPSQIILHQNPNDMEKFECELIRTLIQSYFDIVRKKLRDLVPKTIMHFLVNRSAETMQNELVTALYRDNWEKLLEESPEIEGRRKQCLEMIEALKRGNDILNEVRDFSIR